MKKQVKVSCASKIEKALTWRVSDLSFKKAPSKGDHFVLYTSDGLLIPAYCNRDGKTLYTPDRQVPKAIVNRPSVGDPLLLTIDKIRKIKA